MLLDKLAETKRAEREAKEAHKAALQASKQKNLEVGDFSSMSYVIGLLAIACWLLKLNTGMYELAQVSSHSELPVGKSC